MKRKANHYQPPADEPAATLFDELNARARFDQMFSNDQLEQLKQPLDKKRIKHRPQGGRQVSYLDGAGVIDTANRIFNYGNWGYTLVKVEDRQIGAGGIYIAYIRLHIIDPETRQPAPTIDEVGTGEYFKPTAAEIDKAIKSAITDAVKRALRCYGNQFGLSLYGGEDELATPSTRDGGEPKPETKIRRPTTASQQGYNAPDGAVLLSRQALPDGPGAAKGQQTTNPLPQAQPKPIADFESQIQRWITAMRKATSAEELTRIKNEWKASVPETHKRYPELKGVYLAQYRARTNPESFATLNADVLVEDAAQFERDNAALAEQEARHEAEQTGAA